MCDIISIEEAKNTKQNIKRLTEEKRKIHNKKILEKYKIRKKNGEIRT